jgi:hypothetical protein
MYSQGHPKHLAKLIESLKPKPSSIFIGDLNAHHEWWQGSYIGPKQSSLSQTQRLKNPSTAIANWFEGHNFHLHNKPGIPAHCLTNKNNPSVIDLCLSKGEI